MRRLVAYVLLQAMVLSTATASSLHVHEYLGHDHPEHRHGPASHEHPHHALPDVDHQVEGVDEGHPAMEAAPCDPGRHAVAVTPGCTDVMQVHTEIAELAGPTVITPTTRVQSATPITDVRVHGPPFDPRTPSRAPPLISPA